MRCKNLFLFILFQSNILLSQSDFTGQFQGTFNGDPTTVTLKQQGTKITGYYQETQNTYDIKGEVIQNILHGALLLPGNLLELGTFEASLQSTGLHMDIILLKVTKVTIDLVRNPSDGSVNRTSEQESNPIAVGNSTNEKLKTNSNILPPKDHYERDLKVVGSWIKEEIINSGVGINAAGFTSAYYLTFNKNGTFIQEKGSSAGGSEWSGISKRTMDVSGHWYTKDGIMYVRAEGEKEYARLNKYLFHEGSLVFKTPEGKYLIWNRN